MGPNRLTWFAGGLGLAGVAVVRALKLRRERSAPAAPPGPDPRAAELRRKLAEARDLTAERDEFEEAETPVDRAEPADDLEERRRRVHAEGKAAADEMRGAPPPPVA